MLAVFVIYCVLGIFFMLRSQSIFSPSLSKVLCLRPITKVLQMALCSCAFVSIAQAAQDGGMGEVTTFDHQSRTVVTGSFSDGVFTVATDTKGIRTEGVQTNYNTLLIQGNASVNGPMGAATIRKITDDDFPIQAVAKYNQLVIDKDVVATAIRGVHISGVGSAEVTDNTVTMNGGTVHGQFLTRDDKKRSLMSYGVYAGQSMSVRLERNSVNINDGDLTGSLFGVGGWESESVVANQNTVNITGGQLKGSIFGVTTWNTVLINANNNTVNVSGGSFPKGIEHLIGAWLKAQSSADAHGNRVVLATDAQINKVLAPALIYNDEHDEYGVFSQNGQYASLTDNTVTIKGKPTFADGSYLIGAGIDYEGFDRSFDDLTGLQPKFDFFSGNTLNLYSYGISADKVGNFEYYRFALPNTFDPQQDVALRAKELHLEGLNEAAGKMAKIDAVQYLGGVLAQGDKMVLLRADSLSGVVANKDKTVWVSQRQGVSTGVPTQVKQSAHEVYLDVVGAEQALPQAKVLAEGYLASVALSTQGADLVAYEGIEAARQNGNLGGFKGFAAMSGAHGRYKTGSSVGLDALSLMVGGAYSSVSNGLRWTVGGFFEAGRASYDTSNAFENVQLKGNGRAHYEGLGLLARVDLDSGLYSEASVRFGRLHNKYNSDLYDFEGNQAKYSLSNSYVGAHIGFGYLWKLTDKTQTDFYAKYLFARQSGKNIQLSTGDPLSFDAVTSHRIRVGARMSLAPTEVLRPYVGVAYEREFGAKARATAYGFPIQAPSMKGGMGMLELGVKVMPNKEKGLSADIGVRGYAGKRRELAGQFNLMYRY